MISPRSALAMVALVGSFAHTALAQTYVYQSFDVSIPQYPGYSLISLPAINDYSTVVGGLYASNGDAIGFLRPSGGGAYGFQNGVNAVNRFRGINNGGYVSGTWADGQITGPPIQGRAYVLYNNQYNYININAYLSVAAGINNNNTSAGYGQVQGVGFVGYLTNSFQNQYYYFGSVYGFSYPIYAYGLNDASKVVGLYADAYNNLSSFIFDGSNQNFYTFTIPGATGVTLYGINNSNRLVGSCVVNGTTYGFVTTFVPNGQAPVTFLFYPYSRSTVTTGINNNGVVVGTYVDTNGATHGYLATAAGAQASEQVAGAAGARVLPKAAGTARAMGAVPMKPVVPADR